MTKAATTRKPYHRQPAGQQQERLVAATLSCLMRHGVEATTVRRIAQAADLSQGMIRHHFGGKDQLLAATYKHLSLRLREAAEAALEAAGADPAERLKAFVTAGLKPAFLRDDYIGARLLFWSLSHTNAAVRAVHDEIYEIFERRVAQLLRASLGPGIRPAVVRQRTQLVAALLKGLWLEWSLKPKRTRPAPLLLQILPLLEIKPSA